MVCGFVTSHWFRRAAPACFVLLFILLTWIKKGFTCGLSLLLSSLSCVNGHNPAWQKKNLSEKVLNKRIPIKKVITRSAQCMCACLPARVSPWVCVCVCLCMYMCVCMCVPPAAVCAGQSETLLVCQIEAASISLCCSSRKIPGTELLLSVFETVTVNKTPRCPNKDTPPPPSVTTRF